MLTPQSGAAAVRMVEEGQLKGAFRGFKNRDTYFQFIGGGAWRQADYRYLYQYIYMPRARVVAEATGYVLEVEGVGERIPVLPATLPDDQSDD